jgi:predicted transposase/invertase (TIGR01784 family)
LLNRVCGKSNGNKLYLKNQSFHHNAEETTRNRYLNDHTYVFIELPKFKKQEAELKTEEDYWSYMLKSARALCDILYQAPKEVQETYHILETYNWTKSELKAYEDARKIELDDEEAIETAKEEGRREEKVELSKNMRSMGYKTNEIAKITGLPSNEINNL